jgi:hypothetical protein
MEKIRAKLKSICREKCPTRWCCSVKNFVPPPISQEEIKEIQEISGSKDFYEKKNLCCTLKIKKNAYCIFFDEEKKDCTIYDIKPFDCKIYPFDFFFESRQKKWFWLIWECPYSREMSEEYIEYMLTQMEKLYQKEIALICNYENDSIDADESNGFRVLREMKISLCPL